MKFVPYFLVFLLLLLMLTAFCLHFALNSLCGNKAFLFITKKSNDLSKCFISPPGKVATSWLIELKKSFLLLHGKQSGGHFFVSCDDDNVPKASEGASSDIPNLKKISFGKMSGEQFEEKADRSVEQLALKMRKMNSEVAFDQQHDSNIKNDCANTSAQHEIFSESLLTDSNSIKGFPLSNMIMTAQSNSSKKVLLESSNDNKSGDKVAPTLSRISISKKITEIQSSDSIVKTSIQAGKTEVYNNSRFLTEANETNQTKGFQSGKNKQRTLIESINKNVIVTTVRNAETPMTKNVLNETVRFLHVAQDENKDSEILNNALPIQVDAAKKLLMLNNNFHDSYNLASSANKHLNEPRIMVGQGVVGSIQPNVSFYSKKNEAKVEAFGNDKDVTGAFSNKLSKSELVWKRLKNYESETFGKARNLAMIEKLKELSVPKNDKHNKRSSVDLKDGILLFWNPLAEIEVDDAKNKEKILMESEGENLDESELIGTKKSSLPLFGLSNNISEGTKEYFGAKEVERAEEDVFFSPNSSGATNKVAEFKSKIKVSIDEKSALPEKPQKSRFLMSRNMSVHTSIEDEELVGATSGSIASQAVRYYYGIIHDLEIDGKLLKGKGVLPRKELTFPHFLFSFTDILGSLWPLSKTIYNNPVSNKNVNTSSSFSYSYSVDVVPACSSVLDGAVQSLTPGWIRSINSLGGIFDVAQQIVFSPLSVTRRLYNTNNYFNHHDPFAIAANPKHNSNSLPRKIPLSIPDYALQHHERKLLTGLIGYGICSISKIVSDKSANIMKETCECINKSVKMSYASKCSVYNSLFAVLGCTADPPDCGSVDSKPSKIFIPDVLALDLSMIDLLSEAGYISDTISGDVVKYEGVTYYILWKAVHMMYELHQTSFCAKQKEVSSEQLNFLLPGWETEAYIHAAPSRDKNDSHLMTILLRRNDTLLVLTRGTKTRFEWKMNFEVHQIVSSVLKYSDNSSETVTWPGKVHYGYSLIFESIFPNIIMYLRNLKSALVDRKVQGKAASSGPLESTRESLYKSHPIKRIIVSGHSLGSAVSVLLSYQLSLLFPGKVDMVGFGSPRVGDLSFQQSFRRTVNARIMQFSLDPVIHMPCENMLACDIETAFIPTKLSQDDKQFNYVNDAAIVKITPSMMPTSNWSTLGSNLQAYAMHTCSYSCYLAHNFAPADVNNECRPPQRNEETPYSGEVCPLWLISYI